MKKTFILILSMIAMSISATKAQTSNLTIRENPAVNLKKYVPKGGYSGITRISDNTYAVVSDSESHDGFYKFNITLNPTTGEVENVENVGFYHSETVGRDAECIAYNPTRQTIYVGGERNNSIVEFTLEGKATGLRSGNIIPNTRNNQGMESLCYDINNKLLWTMPESTLKTDNDGNYSQSTNGVANMYRLMAFDTDFNKVREYAYKGDSPENMKEASVYVMGVSDIAALDDGRLLIMEREAYVPKLKYGAWTKTKLFVVDPKQGVPVKSDSPLTAESPFLTKTLLWSCSTTMSFNGLNWANYEGMCLGPKLEDGGQTVLLISDSQNRYKGMLQDWLKTLVIY